MCNISVPITCPHFLLSQAAHVPFAIMSIINNWNWPPPNLQVSELQKDNALLRDVNDRGRREYLVALRKLARRPDVNRQDAYDGRGWRGRKHEQPRTNRRSDLEEVVKGSKKASK